MHHDTTTAGPNRDENWTHGSFSLVYLPIKAPTHEQNNLNNTNTTKHIYRVPVIIYNTSNTVFCVGDAMTHHEGQNNYYFPDHHNVP